MCTLAHFRRPRPRANAAKGTQRAFHVKPTGDGHETPRASEGAARMKPHLDFRQGLWRCRFRTPWGDLLPLAVAETARDAYEVLMLYLSTAQGAA